VKYRICALDIYRAVTECRSRRFFVHWHKLLMGGDKSGIAIYLVLLPVPIAMSAIRKKRYDRNNTYTF